MYIWMKSFVWERKYIQNAFGFDALHSTIHCNECTIHRQYFIMISNEHLWPKNGNESEKKRMQTKKKEEIPFASVYAYRTNWLVLVGINQH